MPLKSHSPIGRTVYRGRTNTRKVLSTATVILEDSVPRDVRLRDLRYHRSWRDVILPSLLSDVQEGLPDTREERVHLSLLINHHFQKSRDKWRFTSTIILCREWKDAWLQTSLYVCACEKCKCMHSHWSIFMDKKCTIELTRWYVKFIYNMRTRVYKKKKEQKKGKMWRKRKIDT